MDIFECLSGIADKKTPWTKFTEEDRKTYSQFMVNKWLGYNTDSLPYVEMFSKYLGRIPNHAHYKLFQYTLPAKKLFCKYIKAKDEGKYKDELITLIANHFQVSKREALIYIELMNEDAKGMSYFRKIVAAYGNSDKEVAKLISTKKSKQDE